MPHMDISRVWVKLSDIFQRQVTYELQYLFVDGEIKIAAESITCLVHGP